MFFFGLGLWDHTFVPSRWSNGLISNGGRFKPAFAERDKKQTMTDLRGISANWFKN
jgi:hypothetical protein